MAYYIIGVEGKGLRERGAESGWLKVERVIEISPSIRLIRIDYPYNENRYAIALKEENWETYRGRYIARYRSELRYLTPSGEYRYGVNIGSEGFWFKTLEDFIDWITDESGRRVE